MPDEPDIANASTTTASQEHAGEQECFRLFDLPPELVIRALEFAVVISTKANPLLVERHSEEPWARSCDEFSAKQPAIMRTCRLLRAEGLKLFYARNVFLGTSSYHNAPALWSWADAIGQESLQRISRLYVSWVCGRGGQICEYKGGKLLEVCDGSETSAWGLLEEVEYLAEERYNLKGPTPAFVQLDYGKVVLDMTYDHPRYRLSFKEQDDNGPQILISVEFAQDHSIFRNKDAVDFWTAEKED